MPRKAAAKPDYNEIATITDGRDITRGYTGPLLQYQDKILNMRGGSDLEIYEEVYRDDHVRACMRQRRETLASWPWEVKPGKRRFAETTKNDEKAADFLREILETIPFDGITQKMHYGFGYGYSIGEIMYAKDENYVVWDDTNFGIKVKRAKRFRFNPEGELRLLTFSDFWQGQELDPRKFWHFCSGADNDDDPYGLGDFHFCYWPVTIKREGLVAWMTFLRRFGMPFVLGKYPTGTTSDEQAKLKRMVQSVAAGTGGTAPEGILLELIEASRGGTPSYPDLVNLMDAAITKILLGETMTLSAEGGQYKGDTHADIYNQMVQADADNLMSSLNRGPISWLIDYNRGMLGDAVPPQVWRHSPDQTDEKLRSEVLQTLWNIGYEPTDIDQINATFGGDWQKRELAPVPESTQPQPAPVVLPEFSEPESGTLPPDQAALDAAVDAFTPEELQGQMEAILAPLMEFIEGASLEEIQEKIAELYPQMDTAEFEEMVARAIFVSEIWGRLNAAEA